MMKSILFLISLMVILPSIPASAIASGSSSTHPHTNALELKPAFSLDNSFQTASICFLGVGDCDPNSGFGKGDDYTLDAATKCLNDGFVLNNCTSMQSPIEYCPESSAFIKGCKCRTDLVTCPVGQVGIGASCGGKYASCQCNPSLVSCAVGQVGVGESCDGQYASCQCNPSLISCPSNKNGSGASCGGKYERCTCKAEYIYDTSNCDAPSGNSCDGKYSECTPPCSGYYECGGAWQYCQGTTCSTDSSKCSTSCASDYFPYTCSSASVCTSAGGVYRNGYCSKICSTPPNTSNWGFWCCNDSCDYSACIAKASYNCQRNPHWTNCINEGGTPEFVKCVGPDFGAFDNNYGYENVGVAPYNAAQYYCRH